MAFSKRCLLIGKEHQAELANNRIERTVRERKRRRVSLLPIYLLVFFELRPREFEHVRSQIRGNDSNTARQSVPESPCHDPGATGNFEDRLRIIATQATDHIAGEWLEKRRAQVTIIIFG